MVLIPKSCCGDKRDKAWKSAQYRAEDSTNEGH